ncbi:MAG: hypothetical protein M3355_04200 [Actinomycetota bacterium]|nr:hypothetical protein [Actinomycetota bacterium]
MKAAPAGSAESIGTQVTQILGEAEVTAAKLLAEADSRTDRVGRDDLVNLRDSLKERIETMRVARERLSKLGDGTKLRLREAASQLAEMPARLAAVVQDPAGDASLDHAFGAGESADDGTPTHLVALMEAADTIAEDLAKTARKRARELEHAARREADRIALKEPKRVARTYDPATRSAGALLREVEALNQLLGADEDEDVAEAAQVEERTEGWNRAR